MKVLIIDNYDSFTFNLYQYVGEILSAQGQPFDVIVKRNNEITLQEAQALQPDRIVISPGPGTPEDEAYFGVCKAIIQTLGPTVPLLGVCLGMQGIAHCFGGEVVRAPLPVHGKTSMIAHDGQGVFAGLPQQVEIMRYHSLMVKAATLPDCLKVTSVVNDDQAELTDFKQAGREIMGVRHTLFPIEGIQFHPESFATEGGRELLRNFLLS